MAENTNYIGVAMGLDVTDLKAGLSEANKQIQLANSEFKAASSGMGNWTKSTEGLSAKIKQLDTVLGAQKSKLAGLEAEYAKVAKEQGENSEAARKLQVQLNNQKAVVNSTQREFDNYTETLKQAEAGTIDLEEVTLKAGKAISKTGKEAESAGGGFTVAKGAVATFAGNALTALIGKAIEAGKAMFALAEETKEYREDMAKLETAFKSGNHSVDTAKKLYNDFYKILGESDRTVEAVNHLAEFTDNTEDLSKWAKIAAGVTAKFGDSLPIEGLTEASNETAKVGKITGVLADALNWAGIKEDEFQAKLDKCSTEQQRAALITSTLNGVYAEAGTEYNKLTAETQKAREATNHLEQSQAKLGEAVQPVVTFWTETKAKMLDWVANVATKVIEGYQNLGASVDLLSESQRQAVTVAQESAQAYRETKAAADELAQARMADVDYVTSKVLPTLKNLVDENGKVKKGEEERAAFLMGEFNQALGTEYTQLSQIFDANGQIKQSIYDVIEAKKAQILLEEYEESYRLAVKGVAEQEKARATQAQEIAAQEQLLNDTHKQLKDAQLTLDKHIAEAKTESDYRMLESEARYVRGLETEYLKQQGILDEKRAEYDETESALYGYYKDISKYEIASNLIMKGETEKALGYLNNVANGFKTAEQVTGKSIDKTTGKIQGATKEQKKVLEQQVIDTEVNARLMADAYESGVEGVSIEMVNTAKEQAKTAKKEFYKVGGDITKGIGEGAEKEKWTLTGAMERLVTSAVNAAKKKAGIKSPSKLMKDEVGRWLGLGVAKGIEETQSEAEKQIEKTTSTILSSASKNLSNFKIYNEVSLEDEAYYWDKVRKQIKEGTQARIDADAKYFEAKKKIADETLKIDQSIEDTQKKRIEREKKYASDVAKVEEKLAKDIQSLWDSYGNKLQSRTDAIAKSMNLFDAVGVKVQENPQTLTNALEGQVAILEDYTKNINKLKSRGLDAEFIDDLEAMGINEAGNIRTLANMTDEQLKNYTYLWKKKRSLAAKQAEGELADEKALTESKIAQLKANAETETKALTETFNTEYAELTKKYEELTKEHIEIANSTGEESGEAFVEAFATGIEKNAEKPKTELERIMQEMQTRIGEFGEFVSSSLGDVKANVSAGIGTNTNTNASGIAPAGKWGTVINAGMTVNYNGNLSRKQLKQLENDNYTSIRMRLKAEGANINV